MPYATAVNPQTGARKRIRVGDPNAFAGGFQLEKARPASGRAAALFGGPDYGTGELESQLADLTGKYRSRYLEGFELPDVVRREAEERTPAIKLTRAGLEAKYTGPQHADPTSGSYIDPDTRRALVEQEQTGGREYLSRVTDKVGRLYDRDVEASRGAVEDVTQQLARARALLDEDRQRKAALEDYEKQKQIEARYRPPSGGGAGNVITFQESVANPLLGFLGAGGQRIAKPDGGFDFVAPDGTKLTVEQAASLIPGATKEALLKGSTNPQDVKLPTKALDTINNLNSAKGIVQTISQLSKKINTATNPFSRITTGIGRVGSGIAQTNPNAALFKSATTGFLATLARSAGERGVLTDQDIARARQLVPNAFDTKVVAERKIKQLEDFLNDIQNRTKQTYTGAPEDGATPALDIPPELLNGL